VGGVRNRASYPRSQHAPILEGTAGFTAARHCLYLPQAGDSPSSAAGYRDDHEHRRGPACPARCLCQQVNGNPHPLGLYIFAEDDDITDHHSLIRWVVRSAAVLEYRAGTDQRGEVGYVDSPPPGLC
jgi:hypothetical protein